MAKQKRAREENGDNEDDDGKIPKTIFKRLRSGLEF